MDKSQIKKLFPIFNEIELFEELSEHGIEKKFKSGDNLIRKGEYIKSLPLIVSGSIKVLREDENGNEVLLYYLEGGNTCAMSITCCLREEKSNIWAITEEDTTVLMIPVLISDTWMNKYNSWKRRVANGQALSSADAGIEY